MSRFKAGPRKRWSSIEYAAVALISLVAQISVLGLLDIYLSGLMVESLEGALLFVLILWLANSILLAPLVHFSIRFHPVLFPVIVFLLNGILVILISDLVPGVVISSIWTAIEVSIAISIVGMIVGGIFAGDDCGAYNRFVVQSLVRRYCGQEKKESPGIIFLEIDGLSGKAFQEALRLGYIPTLKGWLERGSHVLAGWETDLSAQTGGCQPGILHGNNSNIPGFRWYEKDKGKFLTSEKPADVAAVEKRVSDGKGLLAAGGASRANMYSGDAAESILTISTLGRAKKDKLEYYLFFSNPYTAARTIGIFLSHFIVEVSEGWMQLARNQRPRVQRSGFYPITRAVTTGVLRELSVFALVGDMLRGLPSMYATFVGYDEVAHHSGVLRKDALRILKGLDKMFAWLEIISLHAPRPYRFVILSDHGQSNGATFLQRTGKTLEQAIKELVKLETLFPPSHDETWLRINAFLTDISMQDSRSARILSRAVRGKTVEGTVVLLGPKVEGLKLEDKNKAIVLASGNLGLIYFTAWKERMSLEQINAAFPNLIPGLLNYPEIGFVMARSEAHGPLAIGAKGVYHLNDDSFEGENPLSNFGPNASLHLRREDSFLNAPDILVNSLYDPQTGEVAAFEELVGSHGGLGGEQSKAILVYPSDLEIGNEPIVGAGNLHKIIKKWVPGK